MVKIAFIGNYQYNCGSTNAISNYVKAGKLLGHDVRISDYSYTDDIIKSVVPIADKNWKPDLLVLEFESYQFLTPKDIDSICKLTPRSKRVIIDPDIQYSPQTFYRNDSNHPNSDSYAYWKNLYDLFSDIILQPILSPTLNKNVNQFLFYGIQADSKNNSNSSKAFDFLFVGNNWHRWVEMRSIIASLSKVRKIVKKIGIIGEYWDNKIMRGYEDATFSDFDFLNKNNIEILNSAPYGKVQQAMSMGKCNPIIIRPILRNFNCITPRMFETFEADTIPFFPENFSYALNLYGNGVKELISSEKQENKIIELIQNYNYYDKLSREIRESLKLKHSYEIRINQLLAFI